jgi:chromosome segregation ATPase
LPVVQFQAIIALAVTDDATCAQAAEYAKAAKGYLSAVEAAFADAVSAANKAHKSLTALRNQFTERAAAAEAHCRAQITAYLQRKERERLELQAKLQREADEKARKEAEEQRKAEMEEIKRRQEEAARQRLKEIEDLPPWEQPEAPAAQGEQLQAQLEELAAAPLVVQAPQVVLSPVAPAVEGLGTRKGKLTYEVADFNALVQAAAKNPALLDYLQVNDKMVKAKLATVGEKIGEFVPGIKPKRDAGIVIR